MTPEMPMRKMEHICLDCQETFPQPHAECPKCGEEMSPHARVPEGARYGAFEIKTSCPHCGSPLILGGPMRKVACQACQKEVDLPPALWKSVLEDLEDDYHLFGWGDSRGCTAMTQGFTLEIMYGKQVPHCPHCSKIMPADTIEVGEDKVVRCVRCDKPLQIFPAPAWLKEVLPTAVQFYGAERDAADTPPEAAEIGPTDGASPVVMSCPQCAGALRIDGGTERITKCQYCDVDVFLPDELWLRLHPVKTVRRFEVRFEGKTPKQLEAEDKRRREHEAETLRRQQQASAVRTGREQAAVRRQVRIRTLVLALGAMAAGLAGWLLVRFAL